MTELTVEEKAAAWDKLNKMLLFMQTEAEQKANAPMVVALEGIGKMIKASAMMVKIGL